MFNGRSQPVNLSVVHSVSFYPEDVIKILQWLQNVCVLYVLIAQK